MSHAHGTFMTNQSTRFRSLPVRFLRLWPLVAFLLVCHRGLRARDLFPRGPAYEDLRVGNGKTARPPHFVAITYRRWQDDRQLSAHDYPGPLWLQLGAHELPDDIERALTGMREGGTRRFQLAPDAKYVDTYAGAPPLSKSPIVYEVQLQKVD